jgi:hypothetical protein
MTKRIPSKPKAYSGGGGGKEEPASRYDHVKRYDFQNGMIAEEEEGQMLDDGNGGTDALTDETNGRRVSSQMHQLKGSKLKPSSGSETGRMSSRTFGFGNPDKNGMRPELSCMHSQISPAYHNDNNNVDEHAKTHEMLDSMSSPSIRSAASDHDVAPYDASTAAVAPGQGVPNKCSRYVSSSITFCLRVRKDQNPSVCSKTRSMSAFSMSYQHLHDHHLKQSSYRGNLSSQNVFFFP